MVGRCCIARPRVLKEAEICMTSPLCSFASHKQNPTSGETVSEDGENAIRKNTTRKLHIADPTRLRGCELVCGLLA